MRLSQTEILLLFAWPHGKASWGSCTCSTWEWCTSRLPSTFIFVAFTEHCVSSSDRKVRYHPLNALFPRKRIEHNDSPALEFTSRGGKTTADKWGKEMKSAGGSPRPRLKDGVRPQRALQTSICQSQSSSECAGNTFTLKGYFTLKWKLTLCIHLHVISRHFIF